MKQTNKQRAKARKPVIVENKTKPEDIGFNHVLPILTLFILLLFLL